jgi:hypothetical protein
MTLQGRVLLNSSLCELSARRQLKDQLLPASANVEDEKEDKTDTNVSPLSTSPFRRPYLSQVERDAANRLPEAALKDYFQLGEFIHIPMSREEQIIINQFRSFFAKTKSAGMDLEELDQLSL